MARATALSLQTPEEPQRPEKFSFKDIEQFCQANKLYYWRMYNPTTKEYMVTYVDAEKAKKIREILDAKPTSEQEACNTCMSTAEVFSCSVENCGDCFLT